MQILVLGGTVFLSREIAAQAVQRGHEVVCACRGESGSLPEGVSAALWDRSTAGPGPDLAPDVVIDVARRPSWVRTALDQYASAHWVFVSSISVYDDNQTPGQSPEIGSTHPPEFAERDPAESAEVYGAMKVACEELVRGHSASASIVRPGLIVGPGDPTGRFTYWPDRLVDGGKVLAPGDPDDLVQVIDVSDQASWCLDLAEQRAVGTWDAVGPTMSMASMLADISAALEVEPKLTWVPQDFLTEHEVTPWAGERSLPVWLPRPAYDGMLAHDPRPAAAAGLVSRPVGDIAREIVTWLRNDPAAALTGLSRSAETEVLRAWRDN